MPGARCLRTALAAVLAAMLLSLPAPAAADPVWAPAGEATIRPAAQTITAGVAHCTSNFVFYDATDVYLGQAAHCSTAGDPLTSTGVSGPQGCSTASYPIGTEVAIEGASRPGTLAYNSWITMQEVGETDPNACTYNDFALIRIDPADHGRVNPSMPHWGGPTGIALSVPAGEKVVSYGSSPLRFGIAELGPREGLSRGQTNGGWNHTVITVLPGIPGDSGSGFLDSQGRAVGVLSTLQVLPRPVHNGVGDMAHLMAYVEAFSEIDGLKLALGTEPFRGSTGLDGVLPLLPPVLDLIDVPVAILNELLGRIPGL